jgi:hypothetical protein
MSSKTLDNVQEAEWQRQKRLLGFDDTPQGDSKMASYLLELSEMALKVIDEGKTFKTYEPKSGRASWASLPYVLQKLRDRLAAARPKLALAAPVHTKPSLKVIEGDKRP